MCIRDSNDTGYVVTVCVEIHLGEVARHILKLAGEPLALGVECLPQAGLDFGEVPVVYLPRRERARAAPGAGVGDVENVAELGRVAGVVHEMCIRDRGSGGFTTRWSRPSLRPSFVMASILSSDGSTILAWTFVARSESS